MSTFKAQCLAHREVIIDGDSGEPGWIRLAIEDRGVHAYGALLDPADAPAIALAVLEAGGMANECSGMSKAQEHAWDAANSLRSAARFTAAAAEEAARGQRRDELARELYLAATGHDDGIGVDHRSPVTQAAIDRIIDTENELAKERAK